MINKFRGDTSILAPGLETLRELTGRPTYAVLPWLDGPFIDAEDSLALRAPANDGATLDIAVVRLRWMSNFTDLDALASEPGVSVRFTRSAADIERADLVVIPGTKATVEDLRGLRDAGLDRALIERSGPTLGICGGYQMLGLTINDDVESAAGHVEGLGLLPVNTRFTADKLLQRVSGTVWDVEATGYEIRHGRIDTEDALMQSRDVLGTSWHGLLECDAFRRKLLTWVAERRGRAWTPGTTSFAAVREAHLDRLADWFGEHVDAPALLDLIHRGVPERPLVIACSVS